MNNIENIFINYSMNHLYYSKQSGMDAERFLEAVAYQFYVRHAGFKIETINDYHSVLEKITNESDTKESIELLIELNSILYDCAYHCCATSQKLFMFKCKFYYELATIYSCMEEEIETIFIMFLTQALSYPIDNKDRSFKDIVLAKFQQKIKRRQQ